MNSIYPSLICSGVFAICAALFGFYRWESFIILAAIFAIGCIIFASLAVTKYSISQGKFQSFFIPLSTSLISAFLLSVLLVSTVKIGIYLRDLWFLHHLEQFNSSASSISALLPKNYDGIQQREGTAFNFSLSERIISGYDKSGVVTIVFVTHAGGIPAHHYGFMYRSDDTPYTDTDGLPVRKRIAPHWFALFDF